MFTGGSQPNWLAHRPENVLLPPASEIFTNYPVPATQPFNTQTQTFFPVKEPVAPVTPGYGALLGPFEGAQRDGFNGAPVTQIPWSPWPPVSEKQISFSPPGSVAAFSTANSIQQNSFVYSQRNTQSPYQSRNSQSPSRNAYSPFSQNTQSPYTRNAQSPYSRNAQSPYAVRNSHSPYASRNSQSPFSANSPYSQNSPSPYSAHSAHSPGYSKQTLSDNDFQLMLGGAFLGTRLSSDANDQNNATAGGIQDKETKRLTHLPLNNAVSSPQAKILDDQGRLSHPNIMNFNAVSQPPASITPSSTMSQDSRATGTPQSFISSPQKLSHPPLSNFSPQKNFNNSPVQKIHQSYLNKPGTPSSQHASQNQMQNFTNAYKNSVSQSFPEAKPLTHDFKPDTKMKPTSEGQHQPKNATQEFSVKEEPKGSVSQNIPQSYSSTMSQMQAYNTTTMSQNFQPTPQMSQNGQVSQTQGFNEGESLSQNVNKNYIDIKPLSQNAQNFSEGPHSQNFSEGPHSQNYSDGKTMSQMTHNFSDAKLPQSFNNGQMSPNVILQSKQQNLNQNINLMHQNVKAEHNMNLMGQNVNESMNFQNFKEDSFNMAAFKEQNFNLGSGKDDQNYMNFSEPETEQGEVQFSEVDTNDKVQVKKPPRKKKKKCKDDSLIEITSGLEDGRRQRGAKNTLTPEEVFEYMGQKTGIYMFSCNYDSCKEQFEDIAIYIQHCLQVHNAYICHECAKDFTTKSSLLRHRHIHTGLHRFACSICKKTFYRKDKCRAHIKRHLVEGNKEASVEEVCVPAPTK